MDFIIISIILALIKNLTIFSKRTHCMITTCYVIGNCQVHNLSFYLNYFSNEIRSIPIEINILKNLNQRKIDEYQKEITENKNLIILIQNIVNNKFNFFTTKNIKDIAAGSVFTITNFYFKGLHPDISYIGPQENRIQSANGPYNSNIVYNSYLNGLSINECLDQFNYDNFNSLNYFKIYQESYNELLQRDTNINIPFAFEFLEYINEYDCLYTINHPKAIIANKYAQKILNNLNILLRSNINYDFLSYDYLARLPWNAVYDDISKYFNLKYHVNNLFYYNNIFYNLSEFVSESYKLYDKQNIKLLEFNN